MFFIWSGTKGSGKTLNAVELIVEHLRKGRRVVAGIAGLDIDRIRERFPDALGDLVVMERGDKRFRDPTSWPFMAAGGALPGVFIHPGDLVVIDEGGIVFPTGAANKPAPALLETFQLARQLARASDGQELDIIMTTPDYSLIHPDMRKTVDGITVFKSWRMLGIKDRTRVTVFEGARVTPRTKISTRVQRLNRKMFGLYHSVAGGGDIESTKVDRRATAFGASFFLMVTFALAALILGGTYASRYFDTSCRQSPDAFVADDDGKAILFVAGKRFDDATFKVDSRGPYVKRGRCKWSVGGQNGVFERRR